MGSRKIIRNRVEGSNIRSRDMGSSRITHSKVIPNKVMPNSKTISNRVMDNHLPGKTCRPGNCP